MTKGDLLNIHVMNKQVRLLPQRSLLVDCRFVPFKRPTVTRDVILVHVSCVGLVYEVYLFLHQAERKFRARDGQLEDLQPIG